MTLCAIDATVLGPEQPFGIVARLYQLVQILISFFFAPLPPKQHIRQKPLGHVAIIGAGVTGVSSASHLIGHGFEVTIFEQGDESNLGGIWSRVNKTSGLVCVSGSGGAEERRGGGGKGSGKGRR